MNTQRRQRQGFPSSVVRHGSRSGEVIDSYSRHGGYFQMVMRQEKVDLSCVAWRAPEMFATRTWDKSSRERKLGEILVFPARWELCSDGLIACDRLLLDVGGASECRRR